MPPVSAVAPATAPLPPASVAVASATAPPPPASVAAAFSAAATEAAFAPPVPPPSTAPSATNGLTARTTTTPLPSTPAPAAAAAEPSSQEPVAISVPSFPHKPTPKNRHNPSLKTSYDIVAQFILKDGRRLTERVDRSDLALATSSELRHLALRDTNVGEQVSAFGPPLNSGLAAAWREAAIRHGHDELPLYTRAAPAPRFKLCDTSSQRAASPSAYDKPIWRGGGTRGARAATTAATAPTAVPSPPAPMATAAATATAWATTTLAAFATHWHSSPNGLRALMESGTLQRPSVGSVRRAPRAASAGAAPWLMRRALQVGWRLLEPPPFPTDTRIPFRMSQREMGSWRRRCAAPSSHDATAASHARALRRRWPRAVRAVKQRSVFSRRSACWTPLPCGFARRRAQRRARVVHLRPNARPPWAQQPPLVAQRSAIKMFFSSTTCRHGPRRSTPPPRGCLRAVGSRRRRRMQLPNQRSEPEHSSRQPTRQQRRSTAEG